MAMKFPIGTQFVDRRKRLRTIVDFYTTTNIDGSVVKERYVTIHKLVDGVVYDWDVPETTIATALAQEKRAGDD